MNILITGGGGFIGSHLAELLVSKKNIKKVYVFDDFKDGSLKNLKDIKNNKKLIIKKIDIRNYNKLSKLFINFDAVVHLAALSDIVPSIENPVEYINTNFNGTLNILELMKKNNVKKIIYAASSSCYGIPKKTPSRETDDIKPMYPYAFSKNLGEQLIVHWAQVYGIRYISLRLFNVYGTRSRTTGAYGAALGVFLKQKISKKPFTVVGDGKQKRDFIHVKDVAEAFYKSILTDNYNKILNVGYGKPSSVNKMIKILKGDKIFIPKRPGEPQITHANINKTKKILKWKPIISLEDGLKNVLANINYWKNAPLWNKSTIKKATIKWFKYLK